MAKLGKYKMKGRRKEKSDTETEWQVDAIVTKLENPRCTIYNVICMVERGISYLIRMW